MFRFSSVSFVFVSGACILILVCLSGCTTTGTPWGNPETGLILSYRMNPGEHLQYKMTSEFLQSLDIRGQSVEINMASDVGFSVKSEGFEGENHDLGIMIDEFTISIQTPQGEMNPDTAQIMGKSFGMTLSPMGEELELEGTEELKYSISPGKNQNASIFFQAIFPDLPDRPVKVGDTWTSDNTIEETSETGTMKMVFHNVHTLEGYEEMMGYLCARIRTTYTGTLDAKGKEGPMDLVSKGTLEGADIWYFAYTEGWFVKIVSKGTSDSTITGTGPQEISIPETRTYDIQISMIR